MTPKETALRLPDQNSPQYHCCRWTAYIIEVLTDVNKPLFPRRPAAFFRSSTVTCEFTINPVAAFLKGIAWAIKQSSVAFVRLSALCGEKVLPLAFCFGFCLG